jgi:FtsP/CotA-like multicopper oxidase with cupredoxin domain/cytochrome c biogenesis protein CcdA
MAEPGVQGGGAGVSSAMRNWLIGATLFVAAAIIFGLLYLFVIAPSVPSGGVGWFLFSFATGLTMIIMPCTLPLAFVIVPLSMGKGLVRGLSIAIAFGLGVAATLSLYGVAAALLGGLALDALGADLEALKNWVYFVAGTFAFLFALSEIGLLNFHMPTYSGAAPAFIQKQQEVIKAFMLGLFLGNVGVGCPHPATPLILIEIATSGDVLYGWLMFLIHAIGRILPLLLLAFLAILGVNGLNWLMTRKAALERVTGWAMVYVAGFILTLGVFTHDWWVNSGIHSALEAVTQESKFNAIMNQTLGTNVAHVHGLETGVGLFGQPLHWGHWFLVIVWLIPMWWWYAKRRKAMYESPAFKIKALEERIDSLEAERRQIEAVVKMDDLETSYDLSLAQKQIDDLEKLRREEEGKVEFGESGLYKNPVARDYEGKLLAVRRNYLVVISAFLVLTFAYFLPQNFYYKSMSGAGHDDHGAVASPTTTTVTGTPFSTDTRGLPMAKDPEFVTLNSGDTYVVTAGYVQKEVGNRTLRMLAYNGSVPGPFIRVKQGGQINLVFVNNTDVDQTIHSHGLRVNNLHDGVPDVTQDVVRPGETYTYVLDFPDVGIAWYHPHTRDDYGQEMGLYGNYFIDPLDSGYYNPVNREMPLVLDDILIENNRIADFYKEYVDHALLGRFGNQYLVNGEMDYTVEVGKGEVIRFLMTNVSNARTYRLSIPGALIKRVAAEQSKFELETFENELVISPAERLVFEAYFPEGGTYKLVNRMADGSEEVARFVVRDTEVAQSYREQFLAARKDLALTDDFTMLRSYLAAEPQKRLRLTIALTGAVDHSAHAHGATTDTTGAAAAGGHDHGTSGGAAMDHSAMDMSGMNMGMHTMMHGDALDSIQWSDPTNSDKINTSKNVEWIIVDEATGAKSMSIPVRDWTFKQGQLVKIRITNDPMAAHVMQHPIHLHGQRFVVLSENGVPNMNMAWKDTALVLPGRYIDILVDMSNLGEWMLHCHISEHLHAGMMMPFRVEDQNGYATGDEYRAAKRANAPAQQAGAGAQHTSGSGTTYTYNTVVTDTNVAHTDKARYKVSTPEYVAFTFTDQAGAPLTLDQNRQVPLSVTFVSRSGGDHFTSYPGNTGIHQRGGMMNTNVPGTPGFNESMPHSHSLNLPSLISTAYADAGHAHSGTPANFVPTYSVPAYFSEQGEYKAFVEYYLPGDTTPRVTSVVFTVGPASWSVDNYGWSPQYKWWVLLIISLLLMTPLSLWVNRYINKPV